MAKTFSLEETLPDLKVPSLEVTIEKYLYSVRAVANDEEYSYTSKLCEEFLAKDGPILQTILKKREKSHRNWVEDLWLQHGYLGLRLPLQFMNFAGISSYIRQFWPPQEGSRIERMSLSLHLIAKFWKMLREQMVAPHTNSKGMPFSMHQFRTTFNTCRVPRRNEDELVKAFRAEDEGDAPSHSIVIYHGRFFKINLISSVSGNPYTPPQFGKTIEAIIERCSDHSFGEGVAALTALDRNTWADAREHLIELSSTNLSHLLDIESAVHVVSMDEISPQDYTEMLFAALTGNPVQRWRDKSYNSVWATNGTFMSNCDHTAVDGMVLVMFVEFNTTYLKECGGKWNGSIDTSDVSPVEELKFKLDQRILNDIKKGKEVVASFTSDCDLLCLVFAKFGKLEFKKQKIYPDAFVQICLQLTYMRLHGKPAPTYETATTRQFYHGRTETCRTCTPEVVKFCKAFISNASISEVRSSLHEAHGRFISLMTDCQENKGCDRHLFGLAIAAQMEGKPIPKLYTDPMYTKSGGNGNFVLSTSFVGFYNSSGAVTPMVNDGYGVFYRIIDEQIVYTLTAWKHSDVSDVSKFSSTLEESSIDVMKIFRDMRESKM